MAAASIFISRELSNSSPIRALLEVEQKVFRDQSLINFSPLDFPLPSTKWLFFYSKTGVRFFYEKYPDAKDHGYKVGCFGPSTALYCQKYQLVSFHGNTDKGTCMSLINEVVDGADMTFVCGCNSLRSVQALSDISFPEALVYNHTPKMVDDLGHYDTAIITSPLNLTSFINSGGSADDYIAIGHTTAAAMKEANLTPRIAKTPTEQSIALTLKEVLISKRSFM